MAGDEEPKPQGLHPENGNFRPAGTPSSVLNSLLPNRVSQEAFSNISQLRKELIEEGPASFSRATEDVKKTQALITVALKVASEVTPAEGQGPGTETEKHLLDYLNIVQLLIEGSFRVLSGDLDAQASTQDAPPLPFYIWLITELISLGTKVRLEAVEAKIKALFIMITRCQHDMLRSLFFPRHSVSTILDAIATGR